MAGNLFEGIHRERNMIMQIYLCFPGGRHKALTMSYDDGTIHDRRLIDIFNRYGIRGTFHINAGILGKPERIPAGEVKEVYSGHEVAAHTFTHPTIERCPREQIIRELLDDRAALESLVGYPVRGLSYPNGSHNKQIRELLPYLGFEYARVVQVTKAFSLPEDFYQWRATCHHNHDLIALGEEFIKLFKKQYLYLMYVWGHSYEFDRDGNWELIEEFCKLTGNREDIWYATNIEIVDYINAYKALRFSAAMDFVVNPWASSVWLSVGGNIVEAKGGCVTYLK